jgi:hypothetical protein
MTELAPGSVTTADLYRELVGLRGDMGKVLVRMERVDTVNAAAEEIHRDHETRLRVLEGFRWKLFGASCAASALVGAVVSLAGVVLSHR